MGAFQRLLAQYRHESAEPAIQTLDAIQHRLGDALYREFAALNALDNVRER